MSLKCSRWTLVILGLIVCLPLALRGATEICNAAGTRYVKPGGNGGCSNWGDACDLQTALDYANPGDQIWVAEGTYKPTSGSDRSATFLLQNGVALYGGFAGWESSRAERDWTLNETILSGDIGTPGSNSDNSYHVVTGSGTDASAVLDGFTITGGNANGSGTYLEDRGAGMYNNYGGPTVSNVIFTGNSAKYGAGMTNHLDSSPSLVDVVFSGNSATNFGGAIYNYIDSNPALINVIFSGNSAKFGGGMYSRSSDPTLVNVIFSGNSADYGGGMCNDYNSNPLLSNVIFSGNSAGNSGGGMDNWASNPTLVNVTFSGNSAVMYGGAMRNGDASPTLANCIMWGNTTEYQGPQIYNDNSNPTIRYSLVQDSGGSGSGWESSIGIDGGGNIDADPKFLDAANGNLRLQLTSPAIDAGDNGAVPADVLDLDGDGNTTEKLPFDLDYNPRIGDGRVDMGAYEGAVPGASPQIYVDVHATGYNNGSSWLDAFTDLQDALSGAEEGVEIWVAEGTYKPTSGSDRTATFQLRSGVAVYGGFGGWESNRAQRNWTLHETILSGDIGTSGASGDNTYHVVTGSGTDASAVLDGFTISGGNANGDEPHGQGGGMYNDGGSPTLVNISFEGNQAGWGGGMHNATSGPTLVNVAFSGNSASEGGGGIHNYSDSSPTLTNVTFSGNSAPEGGGMANYLGSSPDLVNVTFSGNSADYGGGVFNNDSNTKPTLTNCILWGNTAAPPDDQIYNDGGSKATVTYSNIQGGYQGVGNIDADPQFVDADGADDIVGTPDDDLRLELSSSSIDAGDSRAVPNDECDLDGDGDTAEPLPFDLEGYGRRADIVDVPDTGVGPPPVVDIGACEAHKEYYVYLPLVLKNHGP